MTPIRVWPGTVCTEISRPLASKPRPFEPLVFSRKVVVAPVSLSMRVMRLAWVSVKIRLPSGSPTGPSVPVNPDLMTSTGVPAAATPGIAGVVVVGVGMGGCGGAGCATATTGAADSAVDRSRANLRHHILRG